MTIKPTRKYVRLTPAIWAEIRAHWETGEATLDELAARFGVSTRGLQSHFKKHATVKGAKAKAIAASVTEEIFSGAFEDRDVRVAKGRETRERAFKNASQIEIAVMTQVTEAQKGGSESLRAATVLKALALAATSLQRIQQIKWEALGLGAEEVDELPEIVIRDLTDEEVRKMRENGGRSEGDDDYDGVLEENDNAEPRRPEDDEIVVYQ